MGELIGRGPPQGWRSRQSIPLDSIRESHAWIPSTWTELHSIPDSWGYTGAPSFMDCKMVALGSLVSTEGLRSLMFEEWIIKSTWIKLTVWCHSFMAVAAHDQSWFIYIYMPILSNLTVLVPPTEPRLKPALMGLWFERTIEGRGEPELSWLI